MSYDQFLDAVPPQAPSPRREVPYLRDEQLRTMVTRDLTSLAFAKRHGEVMLVLIMAGRVIEGVLLDCFKRLPDTDVEAAARRVQAQRSTDSRFSRFSPERRENWSFFHFIAVAGPAGLQILRGRTEQVADTLRTFRNLVHPAKELQEMGDSPLDATDAEAANALVGMVLKDVGVWVMNR